MAGVIPGTESTSQAKGWAPPLRVFSVSFITGTRPNGTGPVGWLMDPQRGQALTPGTGGSPQGRQPDFSITGFRIGLTPQPGAELGYCGKSKAPGHLARTQDP